MKKLALIAITALLLCGCENEPYESGDGSLSYMRADFCDMRASRGVVSYAVTDNGDTLRFARQVSIGQTSAPDTTVRALVYYNDYGPNRQPEMLRADAVSVVDYVMAASVDTMMTDPVGLERIWKSANGKYVNLVLLLKTGEDGKPDSRQMLGLVCDSIRPAADGRRHCYFRLYHAQRDVPQYYSTRAYLSLPLQAISPGDVLHFAIRTYDGMANRTIE